METLELVVGIIAALGGFGAYPVIFKIIKYFTPDPVDEIVEDVEDMWEDVMEVIGKVRTKNSTFVDVALELGKDALADKLKDSLDI